MLQEVAGSFFFERRMTKLLSDGVFLGLSDYQRLDATSNY